MTEPMDDPLARLEQEMARAPKVHGDDRTIVETYHALTWAAAVFGPQVKQTLLDLVHRRFPRLGEIDAAQHDPALFADVHERYFDDPAEYAKSVDLLAEATSYAQSLLWRFMRAHRLPSLTLLVPQAMGGEPRIWVFGKAGSLPQGVTVTSTVWEDE
jgi:hypothetical protein